MTAAAGEPDAGFGPDDRIATLHLDTAGGPPPSAEMEQDQRVAHFELLEENRFRLLGEAGAGPAEATLSLREGALRMSARRVGAETLAFDRVLASDALGEAISDYAALCEAYVRAVRDLAPSQIERLDAERREAHAEGARAVAAVLADIAEMDAATGRRLSSLVCAMVTPESAARP